MNIMLITWLPGSSGWPGRWLCVNPWGTQFEFEPRELPTSEGRLLTGDETDIAGLEIVRIARVVTRVVCQEVICHPDGTKTALIRYS